jgi:hypothetical protein
MRYMNLACLLMTLVCLITILLFSKASLTTNGAGLQQPAALRGGAEMAESSLRQQQSGRPASSHKHRHRILESAPGDQDARPGDDDDNNGNNNDDLEPNGESIDAIDRQPFVRQKGAADDGDHDQEPQRGPNSDGFNLFDERHDEQSSSESSSSSSGAAGSGRRSLDDLLNDAKRQLRRQQEVEREMDESASDRDATGGAPAADKPLRPGSIPDPISQVLQDLDGFGLFKSIRARLVDQLQRQNMSARPPTVMRTKNGATIIMSFSSGANTNASSPTINESGNSSSSPAELAGMPSFLRELLALPSRMMAGKEAAWPSSSRRPAPAGFAAITINSEPLLSVRSGFPFAESAGLDGPFLGPMGPLGFALPPAPSFMSIGHQQARRLASPPMPSANGGLVSMLVRASNELANQMRQQLDPAGAAAADNSNSSSSNNNNNWPAMASAGTTTNKTTSKQEPQASQQVEVMRAAGEPAPESAKNESKQTTTTTTGGRANANASALNTDEEVETFGVGRLVAPPPPAPFRSLYATRRSVLAPADAGSMLMIESTSGVPSRLMGGGDASPPPASHALVNELAGPSFMAPFPLMPASVFFMGGGGGDQRLRGRLAEPAGPILRSVLSNVVSDLAQSVLGEGAGETRKSQPMTAQSGSTSRSAPVFSQHHQQAGASRRDDSGQDESDWAELGPNGGEPPARLRSRFRVLDSAGDDELPPAASQEGPPLRFPLSGGQSLFEQMLEQLNGAGGAKSHAFGTIRHTYRGPDGVTVERVIGLPARDGHEAGVQAVPAGVRSQSLSRMDAAGAGPASRLRTSPLARLLGTAGDLDQRQARMGTITPSAPSPIGFISQLLGGGRELAAERFDEAHELSRDARPAAARSSTTAHNKAGAVAADEQQPASDGPEPDSDSGPDEAHAFWPAALPRVRVASARIRLVSPRSDSPPPIHFRLASPGADHQHQPTTAAQDEPPAEPHAARRLASGPFTSPSSPLFGFPALKPAASNHQQHRQHAGGDEPSERADGLAGSQRRQRSFVYHSNHEVAQQHQAARGARLPASVSGRQQQSAGADEHRQQQQQPQGSPAAEPRANTPVQRQQQAGPPLPPATSAVMGRRLDDFVERAAAE